MDDAEVTYIAAAVEFIAEKGHVFLPLYDFDLATGAWQHQQDYVFLEPFSMGAALDCCGPTNTALEPEQRQQYYAAYLAEATGLAAQLDQAGEQEQAVLQQDIEELKFFNVPAVCVRPV